MVLAFIAAGVVMDVWFFHVVGTRTLVLTASGLVLAVVVALLVFLGMSRRSFRSTAATLPPGTRHCHRDR